MRFDTYQQEALATTLRSLLAYVNQRFGIVRGDIGLSSSDQMMKSELVERFLWEHCDLIDDYVNENPDNLPSACLQGAKDLSGVLYGAFFLINRSATEATLLHYTGIYKVVAPKDAYFMQFPDEPLELRGAIAPFGNCIVPIPPLNVMGLVSQSLIDDLTAELVNHGADHLVSDAQVLSNRARAWRRSRSEEQNVQAMSDHTHTKLGEGFHRGLLADLSEHERARLQTEHRQQAVRDNRLEREMLEASCIHASKFPTSLEEALLLLDDEWVFSVAYAFGEEHPSQSKTDVVAWLCEHIPNDHTLRDCSLMGCSSEQLDLMRRLKDTESISLDNLDPLTVSHLDPLVPLLFLFEIDGSLFAWMSPEVQQLMRGADFVILNRARGQLDEASRAARALATMCGIISVDDAYRLYSNVSNRPLKPHQFEMALRELEECASRDDYALWNHGTTDYVISVEISDASAAARVSREAYADHILGQCPPTGLPSDPIMVALTPEDEDDFTQRMLRMETELEQIRLSILRYGRDLPPHPLQPYMLESSPIDALMKLDALQALRRFVDEHLPDNRDDYEFADIFTRSVIVSCVLLSESYNETMDIIRLYHMEDCEGTGYSDTLGRLVTNAYNALPRWALNGWSLEENTERITGRRRFFNEDGTVRIIGDGEPCPCGSGKTYGACCGCLSVA